MARTAPLPRRARRISVPSQFPATAFTRPEAARERSHVAVNPRRTQVTTQVTERTTPHGRMNPITGQRAARALCSAAALLSGSDSLALAQGSGSSRHNQHVQAHAFPFGFGHEAGV